MILETFLMKSYKWWDLESILYDISVLYILLFDWFFIRILLKLACLLIQHNVYTSCNIMW